MREVLIRAEHFQYQYPDTDRPAIDDVSFEIGKGEVVGIIGPNGAGKTTLCSALKGIVPHKTGGAWGGSLEVCGLNVRSATVADLAEHVSMTFQNPETQIIGTTVEEDLAFSAENMGMPPDQIRARVAEIMQKVRLPEEYKRRAPRNMSGGEKQRLAIAASMITSPEVIILDEPTTELDPVGKADVLHIVKELARTGENTVIVVEQDIEYLVTVADRLIVMQQGRILTQGKTREVMRQVPLLQKAGINLPDVALLWEAMGFSGKSDVFLTVDEAMEAMRADYCLRAAGPGEKTAPQPQTVCIEYQNVCFGYGEREILHHVSLQVPEGDFVAVLGKNGTGKTTMVKHLNGLLRPGTGDVVVCGENTKEHSVAELARKVVYVFQNPDHQLFNQTVEEEIAFGPKNLGWSEETVRQQVERALEQSGLTEYRQESPLSLERGLKQILILACVIAMDASIFVVDEPTTGLSQTYKKRIGDILKGLQASGKTIVLITHDMQFVAEYADHIVVVENGSVAAQGTVAAIFRQLDLLKGASLFPPQVTQLAVRMEPELASVPVKIGEFLSAVCKRGIGHDANRQLY